MDKYIFDLDYVICVKPSKPDQSDSPPFFLFHPLIQNTRGRSSSSKILKRLRACLPSTAATEIKVLMTESEELPKEQECGHNS